MKQARIIVPNSLAEITLGQYQEYLKATDGLDQEKDAETINHKAIEHFCQTDYQSTLHIPVNEYNRILEIIGKAFSVKPQFIQTFKMYDLEYGFIPKMDSMTLGEYVDLESSFGNWDKMHQAMAVLYRPIAKKVKDKYGVIPYSADEDVMELMKDMPLDVAMGSTVFFYSLGKDLSKATLNYLQRVMKRKDIQEPLKKALEKNGDGISQFTDSLKETYEGLMKSPAFHYTSV